ncbi:hypothetical protein CXG81DRAFT_17266 [Caulochytrium protostelioides]|uniref:Uncharacterized protein n=1 Tax=Caulochytrium protostelioides TaxID=1555241 RepID=A0A4P9XDF7_9FUNG|nr:hypothetical protein CXG81DRAFT_17266 [Caulochytrium protostelioides]|eukprot:RKP03210.1 hypothetical protein CXG81DRAFT_17266 [Caulochytrium protostelioides]
MHSIFLRLPYDDAPHAPGDTGESLDLEIQYGKLRLVDMSEKMPVLTMQLSQNLPITPELMEQGETLSEPYELILTFERDAHRRFGNRLMELFEERLTATDDLATQTPVAAASTHSQPEATSPHEQGDAQLGPKTSVTVDLISIDRPTYHCEIMSRPSNQIMKPASVAYKDPVDERVDDAPATPQLTKADAVTDEAPAHDPIQKDANAEAEADATGVLDADVHDVDGSWDIPGEPTAKPSAKPKPRPHSRNSKSTAASTKSKSEKQVSKSKKGSPITDLDADSHGKPSGKPSYARSTELPWSAPSSHSKRPKRLAKEQASANLSSMLRDDHDSIDEVALLSDASNAPEEVTPWKAHRQSKRDVPPPTRPNTPVDLHTSSLAVTAMPVSRPTAKRSAPESVHPIDSLDYEADEVGPVPGDGAMDSEIGDSDGDLAQYVPRIREAIARKKRQRLEAEQARKQTQLDAAAEQRQQRQRLKEQQQQRQRPVELKHAKQRAQEKNEAKHLRPTTALLPANESDMDRLDSHFVDLDPDVLDSPDSVFLLPSDRHGTQRRGHPHRQDDRAPPALMDALAATTTPTSKVTAVPMQAFWRRWTGDLSQFLTLAMGQSAPIRQIAKIQSQHLELSKNMLKQLESQLAASQRRYHAQVAGEDTREWARQSAHDVQKQSERLNRCDATIYKQLRSLGEYRVNPFARPMQ